ncbi:hypothetical protein ACC758_39075, partial [Rhizobium ruizarguesonis]
LLSEADAPEDLRIWAMIDTPRCILNAAVIAEAGRTPGSRLDCLVVGLIAQMRRSSGASASERRSLSAIAYCGSSTFGSSTASG